MTARAGKGGSAATDRTFTIHLFIRTKGCTALDDQQHEALFANWSTVALPSWDRTR